MITTDKTELITKFKSICNEFNRQFAETGKTLIKKNKTRRNTTFF